MYVLVLNRIQIKVFMKGKDLMEKFVYYRIVVQSKIEEDIYNPPKREFWKNKKGSLIMKQISKMQGLHLQISY